MPRARGADNYAVYRGNGTGWVNVAGGGLDIAVGPDGNAWLVNSLRQIFAP